MGGHGGHQNGMCSTFGIFRMVLVYYLADSQDAWATTVNVVSLDVVADLFIVRCDRCSVPEVR
jgi:hypothetical protein